MTNRGSSSSLKRSDKRFITKVAEGSAKEVAIAELAVQKAESPRVKSYAQQLVNDHHKLNTELVQLAQTKGVSVDLPEWVRSSNASGMNASQPTAATSSSSSGSRQSADNDITSDRHFRSLATGADFDKAFVKMMVDDHEKDLKMFQSKAKDADDETVRTFASSHLATFQEHLNRAENLKPVAAE